MSTLKTFSSSERSDTSQVQLQCTAADGARRTISVVVASQLALPQVSACFLRRVKLLRGDDKVATTVRKHLSLGVLAVHSEAPSSKDSKRTGKGRATISVASDQWQ